MKKNTLFVLLAVVALALVAWVGCTTKEAVEEPFEETTSGINVVSAKWAGSAHADAASEAYNHWNEDDPQEVPPTCAKCHSSSGFQDYIGADGSEAGKVDAAGKIIDPINCATCHNDAADKLDAAKLPNGTELTGLDSAAICSTCHSGMGFQYEGKTYAGTFKHAEPVNSCTECHDPHSLHTQSVPGSDANLCSTCHSDVTSYQDYKKISMAKVDYDGDGTSESTYDEIEGVRALLIKALAGYSTAKSGATFGFNPAAYPYAFIDTNADGTLSEEESAYPNQFKLFTPRMLKAAYNLMFVTKDPAAYIHNPDYALQLMYDSIESLSEFSGVSTQGLVRP